MLGSKLGAQGLLQVVARLVVLPQSHVQFGQPHESPTSQVAVAGEPDDGGVVALQLLTLGDGSNGARMLLLRALPNSIRLEDLVEVPWRSRSAR